MCHRIIAVFGKTSFRVVEYPTYYSVYSEFPLFAIPNYSYIGDKEISGLT